MAPNTNSRSGFSTKSYRFFIGLLLICAALLISPNAYQVESELQSFSIGKVTSNPRKHQRRIEPMADHLARELSAQRGDAVFTLTLNDMIEKMAQGQVDLFTGSAWEAAALMQAEVAEPIAIKHKRGSPFYHSMIVVRKDSGIKLISDLKGKLIAFEDDGSTSAYRVPVMEIAGTGIPLKESKERPDNPNVLHYRFSRSEQNSSAWLFRGTVDAIALSNSDWEKADNVPEFQRQLFEVIYKSAPLPRAVELVRSNAREETKEQLKELLLNMDKQDRGPEIMDSYHETTAFSEVDPTSLTFLNALADYYANQAQNAQ